MPPPPSYRPGQHTPSSQSSSYRCFVIYFVSVACIWLAGVLLLASLSTGSARGRFADRFLRSNRPIAQLDHTITRTQTEANKPVSSSNPCTDVGDDDAIAGHKDGRTGNRVYFHVLPPWLNCIVNSSLLSSPPAITSLPNPLNFPIDNSPTLSNCQRVDFGAELLRRWQSAYSPICDSGSSVAYEHRIRQARHSGDDYFLEFHHAAIDPADGRVHLHCKPASQLTQSMNYREHKGLEDVARMLTFDEKQPTTAAKDGPVYTLFVRRDCDGAGNLYHCSADLINAFMLLHLIHLTRNTTATPQLPPPSHANTAILFTDDNPSLTKFSLLWQALSPAATPLAAYRTSLTSPLSLPRVYGALQSGANMIWKDFWFDDPCGAVAPILDAFSRFATACYLPQPLSTWLTPPSSQQSSGALRVLVASRRNAKYRRASNEDGLARQLAAVLPAGSSVVLVDLGTLSFEQQVAAVNSVDLLVGMHGAALNLLLFVLPERRRAELKHKRLHLMELFTNEKDRPRTYANMAVRLGIGYGAWVGTKDDKEIELDVAAIAQTIKKMYNLK